MVLVLICIALLCGVVDSRPANTLELELQELQKLLLKIEGNSMGDAPIVGQDDETLALRTLTDLSTNNQSPEDDDFIAMDGEGPEEDEDSLALRTLVDLSTNNQNDGDAGVGMGGEVAGSDDEADGVAAMEGGGFEEEDEVERDLKGAIGETEQEMEAEDGLDEDKYPSKDENDFGGKPVYEMDGSNGEQGTGGEINGMEKPAVESVSKKELVTELDKENKLREIAHLLHLLMTSRNRRAM